MGELDKELLQAVTRFRQSLNELEPYLDGNDPDLLIAAFTSGFKDGVESMRDYAFNEGLNIKQIQLLSDKALEQATND